MKIIFMGTPSFAVPILEALNEKYEVVLVVSQPNKKEGRKGILTKNPVALKAEELGLNLYQPEHIKDEYEYFLNVKADMIVTAAYGQFIPTKILKLYKKAINVHGSLLPNHRGGAPIQRSIINGDSKTGVTIIEMVKKMDAGKMFAKSELEITDLDNSDSMFLKLSILGRDLLMSTIEDIFNDKLIGEEQDEALATISPNIDVSEEKINFNMDAKDVFNLIRGLSSNPGAYATINDSRIKVYSSRVIEDSSNAIPGSIVKMKKSLIVKCKTNAIEFLEIKPEGKKIMKASDFINGQKIFTDQDIFK